MDWKTAGAVIGLMLAIVGADGLSARYVTDAMQQHIQQLVGEYLKQVEKITELRERAAVQDVLLRCANDPTLCEVEGPER